MLKTESMAPPAFDQLKPIARTFRNPFSPRHLIYSRRWMALAASMLLASAGTIAAVPARKRRTLLQRAGILAGLGGAGVTIASIVGTMQLKIERHSFAIGGLPAALDGLRIGHLSDLHLGPWYSQRVLKLALEVLRREEPELIVLTGDFVNRVRNLPLLRAALRELKAPLGIWACLGNHEYRSDPAAVARTLHELGIHVLLNSHGVVSFKGASLVIAGVLDPWTAVADLDAALEGAPAARVVLLAHGPDYILQAARRGVALQLSGHAHAGHINLPWLGPLVVPRFGVRYPQGRYRVEQSWLYVHRGLGGLPVRLGAPPEVALLTLRATHD